MGKPLRVLIVEDVESDAELVLRELMIGGFDVAHQRVETASAMDAALDQPWDIVISDFSLPNFSAYMALNLLKKRALDIPTIIVSGTVGEDTAVEAIRNGARDFMAKGHFARLIPAIERELRETSVRLEHQRLQQQVISAERMALVGTLAAGVTHEINNPLAAVLANLEFARQDLSTVMADVERSNAALDATPGDATAFRWLTGRLQSIEETLKDATDCADRVRYIVRDLKIFARGDDEKLAPVNVQSVLETVIPTALQQTNNRVPMVSSHGQTPPVAASAERLGQVFLTLLVRAANALDERAHNPEVRITSQATNTRVTIEIHDRGEPIPDDLVPHLFDPFHVAHPRATTSGLGLAICQRIIASFAGQLTVQSSKAEGTTFRIVLPAARSAETKAVALRQPDAQVQRAKILVIDDEQVLCMAIYRMFSNQHEVITTTSSVDALQRFERGESYDVILCDLMMPEVTGMEVYEHLLRTRPDQAQRVIFMTGGAFSPGAQDFLANVANRCVDKPFNIGNLRAIVHQALRGSV